MRGDALGQLCGAGVMGHRVDAKRSGPRVTRGLNSTFAFEVVGVDGASPAFRTRAEAEEWLRKHLAAQPASKGPRKRPCLCCGREFTSEGPHNRMCTSCRGRSLWLGDDVRPSVPRQSGRG